MRIDGIKKILKAALNIKPVEIGCDDCEDGLDKYVTFLLQTKEIVERDLILVKEHLETCESCNEEYQSLLAALENADKPLRF